MSDRVRHRTPLGVSAKRLVRGPVPVVQADFRAALLDFSRGIHMGNLEPNQRITQILKAHLEERHATRFITDRWGRGVYWHWICWLPVENRQAKPLSSDVNFGCAKFYVSLDTEEQTFEAGLQVEQAPLVAGASWVRTREDWDVHRLVRRLRRGSPLAAEVARLVREEGFTVRCGPFGSRSSYTACDYRGPAALARALRDTPKDGWSGFQLCYVFSKSDIESMSGSEIVAAIGDIFDELVAAMNQVMTVACLKERSAPPP